MTFYYHNNKDENVCLEKRHGHSEPMDILLFPVGVWGWFLWEGIYASWLFQSRCGKGGLERFFLGGWVSAILCNVLQSSAMYSNCNSAISNETFPQRYTFLLYVKKKKSPVKIAPDACLKALSRLFMI